MDRCKWRKLIKEARWFGWVWVGECFFWYRPTRVVPDQRPLNGRCRCCCFIYFIYVYLFIWRCWLGGKKGIRPVKNWVVGCWSGLSIWSKVQTCIWPSWCHCHSLSLASVKSRSVLLFWYRLTRVVLDNGPLSSCVCVLFVCLCNVSSSIIRPHGNCNSVASCHMISLIAVFQTYTGLRRAMWQWWAIWLLSVHLAYNTCRNASVVWP